ncbi:hypothetical protein [Aggregatibacter actinomycetemcomitans]|uniref:hypothetical protein n=1 Tax=Aggregatibacter actinomycetemcomitans TaxID=714 RepID=UPI00023FFC9E|nr:hypothetical protein [Aggregatibacter actinomycetemcomitans]EHK90568.1 hypothetical protein RHAA1_05178 [Aggregatibacter actinomycetemcomitans RhAA1]KNE77619.1 hypothetical protein RHAA2_05255 [Aggregatibacter actinomycetemcomitans RhAA1]MBN6077271.1 hypothetical protein [Aggregatibacter actinomycetemcomitans]MBN6080055.1 hypothetical protein [Aggregatibacter actinomycetemcomitans]
MKNRIEKFLIYLLKKPQVKAALKEINDSFVDDEIQDRRRERERLMRKMKDDKTLHQAVLDDFCRKGTDFSLPRKFPVAFYMAAIELDNQLNAVARRNDHSGS